MVLRFGQLQKRFSLAIDLSAMMIAIKSSNITLYDLCIDIDLVHVNLLPSHIEINIHAFLSGGKSQGSPFSPWLIEPNLPGIFFTLP